jgi:SAM-dependent methyltransferase
MGRIDPVSFRSGLLPVDHFERRFRSENLEFWTPLLIRLARIDASCRVLDVGCGTGGFTREIARRTGATVTGLDASRAFLERATLTAPEGGEVVWVEGDAETLPFPSQSFDRVLLSLVLHQVSCPAAAVAEAFRALRDEGLVVVRTIAPEDAVTRVPARFLPSMRAADAARMLPIETIVECLDRSGFASILVTRHARNAALDLATEERAVRVEVQARYPMVSAEELEEGVERMRADAGESPVWVDARPTSIIVATRPAATLAA